MTREQTNRILRNAGFRWERVPHVLEDAYTRWVEYEWVLRDGTTEMTIRQAMERGAARGNADCAAWLEMHAAPEGTESPSARERWVRGRTIPAGADPRRYIED